MILKYLGHSFFTLTLEDGTVIATDPYGDFYNYPKRSVRAQVCTISHHHHDHDGLQCISSDARVIDQEDVHRLENMTITGVRTCHDERGGALRGENVFFIIEAEGLRIGHAGDLGHVPARRQAERIGPLDILLLPVGGYYTIDAQTAQEVRSVLRPRLTIPMHYRTMYDEEMPIAPLTDFLSLCGAEDEQAPLLRVTRQDIAARPEIMTMAVWKD